jgi:hypothetical protein
MRAARSFLLLTSVLAAACAPEPVFNDELDLQAVSTAPGELAGTFALFTRAVGPVATPLGEAPSGNDDYLLVERTWDADAQRYQHTSQLCGGDYIPVLETKTVIPTGTWRAIPPSTDEVVEVDHARGVFAAKEHLQLWALNGLDDPLNTPLPTTRAEATTAAFLDNVIDIDEDGNLGVTFLTEGLIVGEVYAAQRKTTKMDGVVLSADRIVGRSDHRYEFLILGASLSLLEQEPQFNDTDRSQSWFEQVRLDEGADCDDVQALVDDRTLGDRPF